MLITTTPNIEGERIKEYLGIVTGEAVVDANLFRDRDIVEEVKKSKGYCL